MVAFNDYYLTVSTGRIPKLGGRSDAAIAIINRRGDMSYLFRIIIYTVGASTAITIRAWRWVIIKLRCLTGRGIQPIQ